MLLFLFISIILSPIPSRSFILQYCLEKAFEVNIYQERGVWECEVMILGGFWGVLGKFDCFFGEFSTKYGKCLKIPYFVLHPHC